MSQRTRTRRQPRRGVLLLIVLSLLVLFVMAGVTFMVVATQFKTSSIPSKQIERGGASPEKILSDAIMQILRGPNSANSVLLGVSLMEDRLGRDFAVGTFEAPPSFADASDGQLMVISNPAVGGVQIFPQGLFPPYAPIPKEPITDYYNGGLLTIASGPFAGHTTRVVAFYNTNTITASTGPRARIVIERFEDLTDAQIALLTNERFLLNGKPFNGVGAGYDPTTADLNANFARADGTPTVLDGRPMALLPNISAYAGVSALSPFIGGMDESYDAVDFQNMFLALMPSENIPMIPSYVRPSLLRYWSNLEPNLAAQPDLLRAILHRPNWLDNPNFSGSNPLLDPNSGVTSVDLLERMIAGTMQVTLATGNTIEVPTWDVDNDGDGLNDSVWLDIGLPVETSADGRSYRPLVAVLCIDMDGRINVNAHGTDLNALPTVAEYVKSDGVSSFVGAPQPAGLGFGTAEVAPQMLANFSSWNNILAARRGLDNQPGNAASDYANFRNVVRDLIPYEGPAFASYRSMPPDFHGRGRVGVDPLGQPVFLVDAPVGGSVITDFPYETNLLRRNFSDSIFSDEELEPLLRWHEFHRGLSATQIANAHNGRLINLMHNDLLNDPSLSRQITTRSSYDPSLSVQIPADLRGIIQPPASMAEIFVARLTLGGATQIADDIELMLGFELRKGEKLNLNRYLGDGYDNNGNNIVDEPNEIGAMEEQTIGAGFQEDGNTIYNGLFNNTPLGRNFQNGTLTTHPPDLDIGNDAATVQAVQLNAPYRQNLARQLYCLMMFLRGPEIPTAAGTPNYSLDGSGNTFAESIAQWAVNVVDFRDPDSIMTPFEYDINPFDGWNVDGDLRTEQTGHPHRRVVWGVERPELLITEALAWHETRLEDLDSGGILNDQRFKPQGRLFLELYNPWKPNDGPTDVPDNELYTNGGVHLNRVASDGTNTSPVWRVLVQDNATLIPNRALREVYFVHSTDVNSPRVDRQLANRQGFFTSVHNSANPLVVKPGRYAVIGPGGGGVKRINNDGVTHYASAIGYPNNVSPPDVGTYDPPAAGGVNQAPTMTVLNNTFRQISLQVTANPDSQFAHCVPVHNGHIDYNLDQALGRVYPAHPNFQRTIGTGYSCPDIRPTVCVVIDQPAPLSISEPLLASPDSYDDHMSTTYSSQLRTIGEQPAYEPPLMNDGSAQPGLDGIRANPLDETMTHVARAEARLQRLANPLLPFDLNLNPYVTVDEMQIDLTVFNGIQPESTPANVYFCSNQRGDNRATTAAFPAPFGGTEAPRNLWKISQNLATRRQTQLLPPASETDPNAAGVMAGSGGGRHSYFTPMLRHTLGYLNHEYAPLNASGQPLRYNSINVDGDDKEYVGAPMYNQQLGTFPWLAWNNRPYANVGELLNVPLGDTEQMLKRFNAIPAFTPNEYVADQRSTTHLMPFTAEWYDTDVNGNPVEVFRLAQLLEYVTVPSRREDTSRWFTPTIAGTADSNRLQPPFNRMSRFREPGRININTIAGGGVWSAINQGYNNDAIGFGYAPDWNVVDQAQRVPIPAGGTGNTIIVNGNQDINVDFPTRFLPSRAAATADMAPTVNLKATPPQGGLLRRHSNPNNHASFQNWPLLYSTQTRPGFDSRRHAYLRHQNFGRLSNILSNQSNVFAVWVTVGYFEVEESAANPTGFELTQEVGMDTGDVKRHRGFYIIDRSLPVGFEPGKDHNVRDTIVLQRRLE